MIKFEVARLKNSFNLNKMYKSSMKNDNLELKSNYNGNIYIDILKKNCFTIKKNKRLLGIIIRKKIKNQIYYIPAYNKSISLHRLLYILQENFNLDGYRLSLKYITLKPKNIMDYFKINLLNDTRKMLLELKEFVKLDIQNSDEIKFRNMLINKEEALRVELQNNIFSHIKNRRELTLDEVLIEEGSSDFLKNMCFILEVNGIPSGYGQIHLSNNNFYLVNFGIIPQRRNNNYGFYFLAKIIEYCNNCGMKNLYLNVDNSNNAAIELYNKARFKYLYSTLNIIFK